MGSQTGKNRESPAVTSFGRQLVLLFCTLMLCLGVLGWAQVDWKVGNTRIYIPVVHVECNCTILRQYNIREPVFTRLSSASLQNMAGRRVVRIADYCQLHAELRATRRLSS